MAHRCGRPRLVGNKDALNGGESILPDLVACDTRGGRTRGVGAASARAACARGWRAARSPSCTRARACGGAAWGVGRAAPWHAPRRSSVVRVALSLSAAASSLIPLSPTVEPAAHGWHTRSCGDSAGLGRCAAARTGEVQLGAALADLLQRRSDRPHR